MLDEGLDNGVLVDRVDLVDRLGHLAGTQVTDVEQDAQPAAVPLEDGQRQAGGVKSLACGRGREPQDVVERLGPGHDLGDVDERVEAPREHRLDRARRRRTPEGDFPLHAFPPPGRRLRHGLMLSDEGVRVGRTLSVSRRSPGASS